MANSANPEINKKIATSALGTLVIATVFFYLGDRYAETLVTYPGQIFDHLSDAFLSMWQTIKDAPFALDMTSNSLLFGGACFLIIWMIWLRYVAFIGNYRSGEESGSARWGTVKEGKKFKDLQTEDNNLLFTKNFGLALHRPKFDPEYDRNSESAVNMMNMVMDAHMPKDFFDGFVCGDEEYGLNEEAHEMASGRKEIDTQTKTKDAPEVDADKEVK